MNRKEFRENVKVHGKRAKEKGIVILARLLFGRTMVTILLLLLQIITLVVAFKWFQNYTDWFYHIMVVLSAAFVIYIVNSKENPAFKLSWMFPLCAFPVFGAALFLFVWINPGSFGLQQKLRRRIEETRDLLKTSKRVQEKLRNESADLRGISHYIETMNGFPTLDGTEAEYFPLGEEKYEDLLVELKKAEKFIFLEYFIIGRGIMWDSILDILKEKAKEGVEVRVMYDGMCALVNLPYHYPKELETYGIKAKAFSPIKPLLSTRQNNRDHRKIFIIDGKTAYTGGINLADEYINEKVRYGHWKDASIRLKGDAVRSFTVMFLQMWNLDESGKEDYKRYVFADCESKQEECNGYVIPYNDDPTNRLDIAKNVYLDILNRAEKYVYIMTPYLILDNETVVALTFAAGRGVDVKILMPHVPDKKVAFYIARTYYTQLLGAGVKIYEYVPGFLHSKVWVSDDVKAVVGSINLDYRSLYEHFECAVYLYKSKEVEQIKEDFAKTLEKCMEITLGDYKRFSLITRVIGRIFRLVGPLM
ncbi:MAG: cardiolipin synthase [Lachnospiraceae bacterium]|nr:cardiolipin synthase [Lachnospiraceae bacterium]